MVARARESASERLPNLTQSNKRTTFIADAFGSQLSSIMGVFTKCQVKIMTSDEMIASLAARWAGHSRKRMFVFFFFFCVWLVITHGSNILEWPPTVWFLFKNDFPSSVIEEILVTKIQTNSNLIYDVICQSTAFEVADWWIAKQPWPSLPGLWPNSSCDINLSNFAAIWGGNTHP